MESLRQFLPENTLFSNPLNLVLLAVLLYTSYPLLPSLPTSSGKRSVPTSPTQYSWMPAHLPEALIWRTYTPLELRSWDGKDGGRILVGIRKYVYDLSAGRNFYGPEGPYGNFAGRDASRGLAKQSFDEDMLTPVDAPIDELKDLSESDKRNLDEWISHFRGKYIVCGELIENSERASRPL